MCFNKVNLNILITKVFEIIHGRKVNIIYHLFKPNMAKFLYEKYTPNLKCRTTNIIFCFLPSGWTLYYNEGYLFSFIFRILNQYVIALRTLLQYSEKWPNSPYAYLLGVDKFDFKAYVQNLLSNVICLYLYKKTKFLSNRPIQAVFLSQTFWTIEILLVVRIGIN
jgi:hypothetical protein